MKFKSVLMYMRRRNANGFTLIELLTVLILIAIMATILLPILHETRSGCSRRSSCASNLNQIGKALFMYADVPANACFPTTSTTTDPFNDKTPMLALNLLYKGYIQDPKVFSCPSAPINPAFLQSIAATGSRGRLPANAPWLCSLSCSYAYDPGHTENDAVVVLAADRKGAGANSDNHGKNAGQNVLIGAGTVVFRDKPSNPMGTDQAGNNLVDDDIFSLNPKLPRNFDTYLRQ